MSTAIMQQSALYDFGDLLMKNQNRSPVQTSLLGGSGAGAGAWTDHPALARAASLPAQRALAGLLDRLGHRRLERTISEPAPSATSRYKTELCRPFEEAGSCKYGDKCQFAHGYRELRNLQRHPKYKTELCRTFHSVGFCPYGPRCHFVHNAEEARRREPSSPGGSVASVASLSSGGSYLSDGSRSPPAMSPPAPPAFPIRRAHSPDLPPSPPHLMTAPLAAPLAAPVAVPLAARPLPPLDPADEARLPVFNRLSSAFGELVIA